MKSATDHSPGRLHWALQQIALLFHMAFLVRPDGSAYLAPSIVFKAGGLIVHRIRCREGSAYGISLRNGCGIAPAAFTDIQAAIDAAENFWSQLSSRQQRWLLRRSQVGMPADIADRIRFYAIKEIYREADIELVDDDEMPR